MMVSSKPMTDIATDLQQIVVIKPRLTSHAGMEVAAALNLVFARTSVEFIDLSTASSRANAGGFLNPSYA